MFQYYQLSVRSLQLSKIKHGPPFQDISEIFFLPVLPSFVYI